MRAALFVTSLLLAGCTTAPPPTDAPADADLPGAEEFCVSKEAAVCARECTTGRYTPDMCSTMCASDDQILARCAGVAWPAGCSPSRASTAACLAALQSTDRIDVPSSAITECDAITLCAP